jgi:putative iron-regulated protein
MPSAADKRAVLDAYADIAKAGYEDSLATARALKTAVDGLVKRPSEAALKAAREAWLAARARYQQTEAFRFGNKIVDDWEGKVNAWPLDEGLIDYVSRDYAGAQSKNPLYAANVIANPKIVLGAKTIDAGRITKALLADTLHEFGKVEANVATGYHAIEFLLWGQDLNGTGPGAGNRPWTDYSRSRCGSGNCARRGVYLRAATDLLIDDLAWMVGQWGPKGAARAALLKTPDAGLAAILKGLGSLSYGELAGERMKLGLMLHDPEEEHDCFSDNTHNSHYYDVIGIGNVYRGRYMRTGGETVSGPSLGALVAKVDPGLDAEVRARLADTEAAASRLKARAETVERYDQMIGKGNAAGNKAVQDVIDALVRQTRAFEKVVTRLKLQAVAFEGSDSLDNPAAVFK